MPVLTFAGNIGSNVPEIARRVSEELKLDFVDRALLIEASRRLGVPVERVAEMDEHAMSVGDRLGQVLHTFFERSATVGTADPMIGASGLEVMLARNYEDEAEGAESELTDKTYVDALKTVMGELATRGNVLILGRGAHMILRDHPLALHVNVIAPKETRIQNLMKEQNLNRDQAIHRIEAYDRGREAYHRRLFKVHPNDPQYYHLTVNSGLMPFDAAVKAIAGAVAEKRAARR